MWKADLAVHILRESHGELVASIGKCLLQSGSFTLKELENATKINQTKIRKALLILIQHGMVEYHQNKHNMLEYKIYVDRVINQIYAHKEVQCAGLLYGDAAEIMVEELLHDGRLPLHTLVESVTNKLNEAIKAQGADLREVQPSYVQDKFERLVATHFIKRCNVPVKNAKGKVVSVEPLPAKLMFTVPPKSAAGTAAKVKQEHAEAEPSAKKPRMSQEGGSDDTIYWEVNHARFLHHFRDQMLVSAVANTLDSEKAAEIMRTILRHCEKTTDPGAPDTLPVSFNEVNYFQSNMSD
ncbi:DNA-directed RNA polymerase III subunit RPC3-like [Babylonia areolata]|uniref:DNA-directed RNA polymerase III subunit RPC3-like n=1 Tax=Babylonia areolata TaxID=304850 RepID=UPI003FD548DE